MRFNIVLVSVLLIKVRHFPVLHFKSTRSGCQDGVLKSGGQHDIPRVICMRNGPSVALRNPRHVASALIASDTSLP